MTEEHIKQEAYRRLAILNPNKFLELVAICEEEFERHGGFLR